VTPAGRWRSPRFAPRCGEELPLPATHRESAEQFLRETLAAAPDGLYRREVIDAGRERGFSERLLSDLATGLKVKRVRQGQRDSIWRWP